MAGPPGLQVCARSFGYIKADKYDDTPVPDVTCVIDWDVARNV